MRHKRHGTPQEDAEVNMTPMLDIVFIMLIFFIVTATFVRESGLDVTRPDDQQEETPNDARAILVQITDESEIFVNRRAVDERAVRANIERLIAESPKSPVVIQTERGARTGLLISIMDQAKLANAVVSIAPLDQ